MFKKLAFQLATVAAVLLVLDIPIKKDKDWYGFPDRSLSLMDMLTGVVHSSYVPTAIKSIQHRTITIVGTATSNTDTITSVNTANTVLSMTGFSNGDGAGVGATNPKHYFFGLTLTNGTTVTVSRNGNTNLSTFTIPYDVVEYRPGVLRSVTYGTITITNPATSGTATVSLTDTAKSSLSWLGFTTDATATSFAQTFVKLVITNTTTLTASIEGAAASFSIPYCVLEYR